MFLWIALGIAFRVLPEITFAQDPCQFVPGGCPAANILTDYTIPGIITLLLRIVAGGSVVLIVFSGVRILLSWGDESKISQAKWAVLWILIGLSLAITSQIIVGFVTTEPAFVLIQDEVGAMAAAVSIMITIFNAIFLVVLGIAGVRMVLGHGREEEFSKGRTLLVWSIGAAILVNVSHALIQAVLTFFE